MLSEWLLWGITPYCTLKLFILLRGWSTYNAPSLFSSASVCIPFALNDKQNSPAVFLQPPIDSEYKVREGEKVHWFSYLNWDGEISSSHTKETQTTLGLCFRKKCHRMLHFTKTEHFPLTSAWSGICLGWSWPVFSVTWMWQELFQPQVVFLRLRSTPF